MSETRRVYLKLKGKFIGVDPTPQTSAKGPADKRGRATVIRLEGDAQFPVYADRESGGSWEAVDLTKHADGTFDARFVASGRQLSLTPNGLETRSTVGAWETVRAHEQPPDWKTILLYRSDAPSDVLEAVPA